MFHQIEAPAVSELAGTGVGEVISLARSEAVSRPASRMNDLLITRQFIEQATPETLREELLRHIDDGVRAIHISLTLPLREPVRCIARTDTLEPPRNSSATASMPAR